MSFYRLILFLRFSVCLLSCDEILHRSYKTLWLDKGNHYAIMKNMVDTSCNVLSIITRERNFKRLECVSGIDDDDHFIIAETTNAGKAVQYWIINKDKDKVELVASQIVEGPFNLIDFKAREKELGINNLNFQKQIN